MYIYIIHINTCRNYYRYESRVLRGNNQFRISVIVFRENKNNVFPQPLTRSFCNNAPERVEHDPASDTPIIAVPCVCVRFSESDKDTSRRILISWNCRPVSVFVYECWFRQRHQRDRYFSQQVAPPPPCTYPRRALNNIPPERHEIKLFRPMQFIRLWRVHQTVML